MRSPAPSPREKRLPGPIMRPTAARGCRATTCGRACSPVATACPSATRSCARARASDRCRCGCLDSESPGSVPIVPLVGPASAGVWGEDLCHLRLFLKVGGRGSECFGDLPNQEIAFRVRVLSVRESSLGSLRRTLVLQLLRRGPGGVPAIVAPVAPKWHKSRLKPRIPKHI